jgi:hypothetical protein
MKRTTVSLIWVLGFIGLSPIGSLATAAETATVSFGQWETDVPLDRVTTPVPAAGASNHHELIPDVVTLIIPGDGAVNFIIAGLHNPQVYDDGTQPEDINVQSVLPGAAGGIIDDPNNRLYRGLDPNVPTNPRDRVEVVRFSKPGTYLVICGVLNHFVNDAMFGFVKVVAATEEQTLNEDLRANQK